MQIPSVSSLVELLQFRSVHDGESLAYAYTPDGDTISERLTYRGLYESALELGCALRDLAGPGERAILSFPAGPEFITTFFACQMTGIIAVPVQQSRRRQSKTLGIARDCGAELLLSTSDELSRSDRWDRVVEMRDQLRWIAVDRLEGHSRMDAPHLPQPADLAYLQYTSGSTSDPKGVMISHANVLANVEYINYIQQNDDDSVFVTWLPHFHDMGLVEGLLEPLYTGRPVYVLNPVDFIHSPIRWLRAVSRFGATNSGGPTFAYDLCVERIWAEESADLDLSRWREAYCGAEPIRPKTLLAFHERFEPHGFHWKTFIPSYGLAEATLLVSSYRLEEEAVIKSYDDRQLEQGRAVEVAANASNARVLAASGRAVHNSEVCIVDPKTMTPLPECRVGEVWINGPHVARGYWPGSERDEPVFRAKLKGKNENLSENRRGLAHFAESSEQNVPVPLSPEGFRIGSKAKTYLRTGDLGFLDKGDLFVTGRLKELIIIRGRNLYPSDIESLVQGTDDRLSKGRGVAIALEKDGLEHLVIVQEVNRGAEIEDAANVVLRIREGIAAEFEVSTHRIALVRTASIPITTSGKLRRIECRKLLENGKLQILAEG